MSVSTALIKRNVKLFFKDKGMFLTSLITPAILLVLYVIFGWDRCERVHGKRERGKGKRSKKK